MLDVGPLYICRRRAAGLHVGPPKTGAGTIPETFASLYVDPMSLNELPYLASFGEDAPSPIAA